MTNLDASTGVAASSGDKPLNSFFRMAVVAGVESAVRLHIDRGDDVNARDFKGQTPLMIAAGRNKTSVCRLLLDAAADTTLVDTDGKNALSIALAAGAADAAALLSELAPRAAIDAAAQVDEHGPDEARPEATDVGGLTDERVNALVRRQNATFVVESPQAGVEVHSPNTFESAAIEQSRGPAGDASTPAPQHIASWDDEGADSVPFDLSSWIPDDVGPPPADYVDSAKSAAQTQAAINDFLPIDSWADWVDVDVFLPEQSTSPQRSDDERSVSLRLLLLRALREGSVPEQLVEDFAIGDDREPDPEIERALRMTLDDIGAEADERFECLLPDEDYRVTVDEHESPDEEDTVREAINSFEDRASDRNAPIRFYGKQLSRQNTSARASASRV